jgi:hypothetical protein
MTSPHELNGIVQRLNTVERQLATVQVELDMLRERRASDRRLRRRAHMSVVAAVIAAVGVTWSATMRAQQTPGLLTVRGLKVVDLFGKRIIEVGEGMSSRGIVFFDAQDQYAGEFRVANTTGGGGKLVLGKVGVGAAIEMTADSNSPTFKMFGLPYNPMEIDEKGVVFDVPAINAIAPGGQGNFVEIKPGGTMLRGLVTVRDAANQPVVTIDPGAIRGLTVFNANGLVAAQVASVGDSAFLIARDGRSKDPTGRSSSLWMSERGGGLDVRDRNGTPIVQVQDREFVRDLNGNVLKDEKGQLATNPRGLAVFNEQGSEVALLGVGEDAGGRVRTLSTNGTAAAEMGVVATNPVVSLRIGKESQAAFAIVGGKAGLNLRSASGVPLVALTEGQYGGRLQLGDAAGNAMVEAGVLESGVGVVRALPFGNPGGGLLGLPGTFIVGRNKGGGQ